MRNDSRPHAVSEPGAVRLDRATSGDRLIFSGALGLASARSLDQALRRLDFAGITALELVCGGITDLDTTGAWLLLRTERGLQRRGVAVTRSGLYADGHSLLAAVDHACDRAPVQLPRRRSLADYLEQIGRAAMAALQQGAGLLSFFGMVTVETGATLVNPRRLRIAALVQQIEQTGLDALPILGLLSFLIGIVFAYQGSDQLKRFGAEIFTVNLLGVSILREIGGLMTAIIVAGRSGSAFTAQIGTMKVNEELDAIEVLGLSVTEVLVLPRLLALVITLPLLTFFANFMGLVGGALMANLELGITVPMFLRQLRGALMGWTFWIGLIKAPVFALLIGLVGCFEGLQVERNAASVGRLTTQAVVESIFLVILADAAFSILFSVLHV